MLERCELHLGNYDAALAAFEQARAASERAGGPWFLWSRTGAVWAHAYRGRWADARAVGAELVAAGRARDDRAVCAHALLNLALVSADAGDPVRAEAEARQALDLAPTPIDRAMAEGALAIARCDLGAAEPSLGPLERAVAALAAGGLEPAALVGGVALGRACALAGRPERARATLIEYGARAERAGMRFQQARAARILAELDLDAGDDAAAAARLDLALHISDEIGAENERAHAQAARGHLLARRGDVGQARECLGLALATFERLGTRGAPDAIRATLAALTGADASAASP